MPAELPEHPDLEWLRKKAKRVLRAARAGDPEALARVRAVARLAGLDPEEISNEVQLTDAQHAIALEYAFESWPKLKREIERREPLAAQIERFLEAIRDARFEDAAPLLERFPAIARAEIATACALGDHAFVAEQIARDPASATRVREPEGWAPLLYACSGDPATASGSLVRCAEALLDAGASPNTFVDFDRNDPGTPLRALYFASSRGNAPLTRLLLERGANPNDGESVYHAAEHDHRECLELLLAHGADISNANKRWTNTPLFFLMGYPDDHPEIARVLSGMRWLLENGADPNVPSYEKQETPLHAAARDGRRENVIELLVSHGGDLSRPCADGATPYRLAVRNGRAETAELLARLGASTENVTDVEWFLAACLAGDGTRARALLAANAGLMASLTTSDRGRFGKAAVEDRLEAVKLALEFGLDPDEEGDWAGTLLHHAAWGGRVEIVRLLLARGVRVNVRDRQFGSSALGWACHGARYCRHADDDYVAIVDLLLDAGADRETSINRWGGPPERMGNETVTRRLIARGFVPRDAFGGEEA